MSQLRLTVSFKERVSRNSPFNWQNSSSDYATDLNSRVGAWYS